MAMSAYEQLAKKEIQKKLLEGGYKTYAKILNEFNVNLTDDNNTVAYMIPNEGQIVVNQNLSIDQVSMVVRHEILHQYLKHHDRLIAHLAEVAGLDKDNLSDLDLEDLQAKLYSNKIFNIAGDYEISNRGYTEADKKIARNLYLNGEYVRGLVTEDDHPDWVDLSVEEMYDRLAQDYQNQKENLAKQIQDALDQQRKQKQKQQSKSQSDEKGDSQEKSDDSGGGDNSSGNNTSGDDNQAKQSKGKGKGKEKSDDKQTDQADTENSHDGNGDGPDIEKIKKMLNDDELKDEIFKDIDAQKDKEQKTKLTKEIEKYRSAPIQQFKRSLNSFISRELSTKKGTSWSRLNKTYAGTGIVKPGKYKYADSYIPSVNVYFDQSGSWSESDIQKGWDAIGALRKYVRLGKLKLNIYYFSNNVHANPEDARNEGGTNGEAVMKHIISTKPDNVIIMTDSDTSNQTLPHATIPGACWLLYRNGERSTALTNAITAKKGTKVFDI